MAAPASATPVSGGGVSSSLERWSSAAPLTGVLFVVLVLIGGPVLAGSTPGAHASGARIIVFYAAHRERERAAAIVLAFSFVAFLLFAGTLRARWRRLPGAEALTALLLAGAAILAVGQGASDGVKYALTEIPSRLSPSTAQALNLVGNDLLVVSAMGFFTFNLLAGLTVLRSRALPPLYGWAALLLAISFVIPPIEFAGFLVLLLWVVAASIRLLRSPRP